jgi:hypothetical protein
MMNIPPQIERLLVERDPDFARFIALRSISRLEEAAPRKRTRKPVSVPDTVDPSTPLRLDVAARLAYPDGSMSAAGLRRSGVTIERTNGKIFTTLFDIEEMRKRCRVPAKAHDSGSDRTEPTEQPSTSSSTEERRLALAAAKATLSEPSANSKTTFAKSTTRRKQSAKVIPIRS